MSNLTINISANDLQEQTSYEPLPQGTYNAVIFNAEVVQVKNGENAGKPQFSIQFKVTDGQYENRRVFTYIPLYTGKAFWKTQAFFTALGYDLKDGQFTVPTPNEISGKAIAIKVKVVPDQDGNNVNNVAGFAGGVTASPAKLSEPAAPAFADSPWA